jgi:hypothetical protein
MAEPRWTVLDGGEDRASALLDRGVVAGVFYKPWGAPLVKDIAGLLNATEPADGRPRLRPSDSPPPE